MAQISAEEVANVVGLAADELSKPCDSAVIPFLADCFRQWRVIFGSLLSEVDLGDVDREYNTEEEKRIAALRQWKARNGYEATYKILVDALLNRGERDQAENLCKILAGHSMSTDKPCLHETTTTSSYCDVKESESVIQFRCPCGKCSIETYLQEGCPKLCIPYLGMTTLSKEDQENLNYILKKDTKKIMKSFANLFNRTFDSLKRKGITVDNLVRLAVRTDSSLHDKFIQSTSVDEVSIILAPEMSFFNHDILTGIINIFGDTDDKDCLADYSKEFEEFCKRKVFEVEPGHCTCGQRLSKFKGGKQFAVVLPTGEKRLQNLGDAVSIKETLADVLGVPLATLHLHRINRGGGSIVEESFLQKKDVKQIACSTDVHDPSSEHTPTIASGTPGPGVVTVGHSLPTSAHLSTPVAEEKQSDPAMSISSAKSRGVSTKTATSPPPQHSVHFSRSFSRPSQRSSLTFRPFSSSSFSDVTKQFAYSSDPSSKYTPTIASGTPGPGVVIVGHSLPTSACLSWTTLAEKKQSDSAISIFSAKPQGGDLEGMMASIHLKDERIPFIIPPQSLEFDSSGADFVGFGEIRIQIPPYAIPNGGTGWLEVGVCLYGPFKFEQNYRPISPILWSCLNTHLDKPVKVTLPHILPNLSEDELASFGVRFTKASHDCVSDASGERVYQFRPSVGNPFYYAGGGKGYGALETNHFCFMCLEAENGVTYDEATRMGYCFTSVQGPSQLCIYATYFLNTCMTALEKQLEKDDRILTSEHFTLRQGCDHVTVSCDPRDRVNMIPSNGKIRVTKIDFWSSGKSYKEMKLDHEKKMYPPKVAITTKDLSSVQNIRVMFSNLKENDDLDMDVTLYQGTRYTGASLPSTDVSFKRQEGDKSDFEVIKTEANYCIPPCWSLEGAHRKGIDGEGITIAILDSAINRNHDAFGKTTLSGKNFIDEKRDEYYWCTNREEHGTMVTGIIAKYAPKAEIYVCCVSEENKFKPKAIIKALEHLKKSYEDEYDISDKKECHVIVMSFGHYNREEYEDRKKLINDLASKGVICVAAIGNCGLYAGQLAYPALLDEVIAVGGLKGDGCEAATFNPPGEIDMYGPGEAVCYPADTNNSKYRKGRGTSCAAPAIGGIVALLMQLARKSGVDISNVQLIKKIFSHMKTEVPTTLPAKMEEKIVYNPRKFFCELYETPDKFKALIETIQSSPS